MTRSKRMSIVQKVVDDRESRQAVQLGASQRRVADAEKKLLELERYQLDYQREFTRRAQSGSSGLGLGDFRVFLARLTDAVAQQKAIVQRTKQELDAERRRFQAAATKASAVRHVVGQWAADERRAGAKREQHESDERAQRTGRQTHE